MGLTDSELINKNRIKKSNIIKKLLRSFNSKKKKMKQKQAHLNDQQDNHHNQLTNKNSTNNLTSLNHEDHSVDLNQSKTNLQLNDKDRVDDELILMKTVNSNNCLEVWREIQMDLKIKLNKLKPEVENSILNEINKCLELHQSFVLSYKRSNKEFLDLKPEEASEETKASVIRRCLLQLVKLNSNSMQELMKISLQLESAEE